MVAISLNAYEHTRKRLKVGGENCREISSIFMERSQIELEYSRSLSRLSTKLSKVASTSYGPVEIVMRKSADEMENEAHFHKLLSSEFMEDLYHPLRTFYENHYKTRKSIQAEVDKNVKEYEDMKRAEITSKTRSFLIAKDTEKAEDQLDDLKTRKKSSEKEEIKLRKKIQSMSDNQKRIDDEYLHTSLKTELAREAVFGAVRKGIHQFEELELERITTLKTVMLFYHNYLAEMLPNIKDICSRLSKMPNLLSIENALDAWYDEHNNKSDENDADDSLKEQSLLYFFAEDLKNFMASDRRQKALENYSDILKVETSNCKELQLKASRDIQYCIELAEKSPHSYKDEEYKPGGMGNAKLEMIKMNAHSLFLEGCLFKCKEAIAELKGDPVPFSRVADYISHMRDEKSGISQVTLTLPDELLFDGVPLDGPKQHHAKIPTTTDSIKSTSSTLHQVSHQTIVVPVNDSVVASATQDLNKTPFSMSYDDSLNPFGDEEEKDGTELESIPSCSSDATMLPPHHSSKSSGYLSTTETSASSTSQVLKTNSLTDDRANKPLELEVPSKSYNPFDDDDADDEKDGNADVIMDDDGEVTRKDGMYNPFGDDDEDQNENDENNYIKKDSEIESNNSFHVVNTDDVSNGSDQVSLEDRKKGSHHSDQDAKVPFASGVRPYTSSLIEKSGDSDSQYGVDKDGAVYI